MNKDQRIKQLEEKVKHLQEKEKKLKHDVEIFKKIFDHLHKQMQEIKKEFK